MQMKTTVIEQLTALRLIIIRKTEKEKKTGFSECRENRNFHSVGGNATLLTFIN